MLLNNRPYSLHMSAASQPISFSRQLERSVAALVAARGARSTHTHAHHQLDTCGIPPAQQRPASATRKLRHVVHASYSSSSCPSGSGDGAAASNPGRAHAPGLRAASLLLLPVLALCSMRVVLGLADTLQAVSLWVIVGLPGIVPGMEDGISSSGSEAGSDGLSGVLGEGKDASDSAPGSEEMEVSDAMSTAAATTAAAGRSRGRSAAEVMRLLLSGSVDVGLALALLVAKMQRGMIDVCYATYHTQEWLSAVLISRECTLVAHLLRMAPVLVALALAPWYTPSVAALLWRVEQMVQAQPWARRTPAVTAAAGAAAAATSPDVTAAGSAGDSQAPTSNNTSTAIGAELTPDATSVSAAYISTPASTATTPDTTTVPNADAHVLPLHAAPAAPVSGGWQPPGVGPEAGALLSAACMLGCGAGLSGSVMDIAALPLPLGMVSWSLSLAYAGAAAAYFIAAWSRRAAARTFATPAQRAALLRQARLLLAARAALQTVFCVHNTLGVAAAAGEAPGFNAMLGTLIPSALAGTACFLTSAHAMVSQVYMHMGAVLVHMYLTHM